MSRYFLKRLLMLIPVLLGVSVLIFSIVHLAPGDPAEIMMGPDATQEELQAFRVKLGFDRPLVEQYFTFIGKALRGDLGESIKTNTPVMEEIAVSFPATLTLAFLSMVFSVVIGLPLGALAALKQNTWVDALCSFLALAGFSIPAFWVGLMFMLFFSIAFPILPSSGWGDWRHLILPTVVLGIQSMAIVARMTRSSMLEVIRQDYIATARSKGIPYRILLFRHILSNAMIPIVTVVGLSFGASLGGVVVTETIFSIPGIGRLIVDAIRAHDYPLVQGGVLFFAFCVGIVNLLVDMLYAVLDPRINAQSRSN